LATSQKTGESLNYAFIGFDDDEAAEQAYFKMNNVLIDDRRIKVCRITMLLIHPLRDGEGMGRNAFVWFSWPGISFVDRQALASQFTTSGSS